MLQVDHLTGEEVGCLVETLHTWGAYSVHVVPTMTKKSRPGHLLWVDVNPSHEHRLTHDLARQFGVSGYHRLETVHCHSQVGCQTRSVEVRCDGRSIRAQLGVKVIGNPEAPLFVRVEHDTLLELSSRIFERFGFVPSLPKLRHRIEAGLCSYEQPQLTLELGLEDVRG